MADLKISQFVDGGPVQTTDEIATNRAGVNTKVFVGSAASADIGTGVGDVITFDDDGLGNPAYPPGDGSNILVVASNVMVDDSNFNFFTGTDAQTVLEEADAVFDGLRTAAFVDTGTGSGDVPLNSDLGSAAFVDVGTGGSNVPLNSNLGSLAYKDIPTMPAGGMYFDGSTYLDGNPLTGIVDGKKGTFFAQLKFDNSASATEQIFQTSGGVVRVNRTPDGHIFMALRNSGGTDIFSVQSSNTVPAGVDCNILASWDLGSGLGHLYVNEVSTAPATITNDTIDYTVTEYSVGATNIGGSFFTGDLYFLYFNAEEYIDLSVKANRRKFYHADGMIAAMGPHGERVTGNKPILFMGYDDNVTFASARGSQTVGSFAVNGTPAAPQVPIECEYEPNAFIYDGVFTPVASNASEITSLTTSPCGYSRNGADWTAYGQFTGSASGGSSAVATFEIAAPIIPKTDFATGYSGGAVSNLPTSSNNLRMGTARVLGSSKNIGFLFDASTSGGSTSYHFFTCGRLP